MHLKLLPTKGFVTMRSALIMLSVEIKYVRHLLLVLFKMLTSGGVKISNSGNLSLQTSCRYHLPREQVKNPIKHTF